MITFKFSDINECLQLNETKCNRNARCINMNGSYACECLAGYSGNGIQCKGEFSSIFPEDLPRLHTLLMLEFAQYCFSLSLKFARLKFAHLESNIFAPLWIRTFGIDN